MAARKARTLVVLDTNVLIAFYLSRSPLSPNAQVVRLWRDRRKLQLLLSKEVAEEYLEVLERLGAHPDRLRRLATRFNRSTTVSHVQLGPRVKACRDPEDNIMLSLAKVGKAKFLITNDRDLLEIPAAEKRKFRFQIVTPRLFLAIFKGDL